MGLKELKIGKNGFNEIYSVLYKKFGFDHMMKTAISCSYDFVTGLLF